MPGYKKWKKHSISNHKKCRRAKLKDNIKEENKTVTVVSKCDQDLILSINTKIKSNNDAIIAINHKADENGDLTKKVQESTKDATDNLESIDEDLDTNEEALDAIDDAISLDTLSTLSGIFAGGVTEGNTYHFPKMVVDSTGRVSSIINQIEPFHRSLRVNTTFEGIGGNSAVLYAKETISVRGNRVFCSGVGFFDYNIFDIDISFDSNFIDVFNILAEEITAENNLKIKIPVPIKIEEVVDVPAEYIADVKFVGLNQGTSVRNAIRSYGTGTTTSLPFSFSGFIDSIIGDLSLPIGEILNILQTVTNTIKNVLDKIKSISKVLGGNLGTASNASADNLPISDLNSLLSFVTRTMDIIIDVCDKVQRTINAIPGIDGVNFCPNFNSNVADINLSAGPINSKFFDVVKYFNDTIKILKNFFSEIAKLNNEFTIPAQRFPGLLDLVDYIKNILAIIQSEYFLNRNNISKNLVLHPSNEHFELSLEKYVTTALRAVINVVQKKMPKVELPLFRVNYEYSYLTSQEAIAAFVPEDIVNVSL